MKLQIEHTTQYRIFLIIKANQMHYFSNLFWYGLLMMDSKPVQNM